MLGHIDPSLIDWSRAQFALTAIYHWLFVPLTLGLAVVMGLMETIYYRTGDDFWRRTARFGPFLDETLRHQLRHRRGHGSDTGV